MAYAILRFAKRKGGAAKAIAAHNERTKEAYASNPDIDKSRTVQNYHLIVPRWSYGQEIRHRISMAGFVLNNTLSEHGGVTRGLCEVDEAGRLKQIVETKNIIRHAGGAAVLYQDGTMKVLNPDMPVSMNMWGFQPDFIGELKAAFPVFLREHAGAKDEQTAEFLLPTIVGGLLRQQKALIDVLPISDRWFGVTYQEDVLVVKESFRKLIAEGLYPEKLWG